MTFFHTATKAAAGAIVNSRRVLANWGSSLWIKGPGGKFAGSRPYAKQPTDRERQIDQVHQARNQAEFEYQMAVAGRDIPRAADPKQAAATLEAAKRRLREGAAKDWREKLDAARKATEDMRDPKLRAQHNELRREEDRAYFRKVTKDRDADLPPGAPQRGDEYGNLLLWPEKDRLRRAKIDERLRDAREKRKEQKRREEIMRGWRKAAKKK